MKTSAPSLAPLRAASAITSAVALALPARAQPGDLLVLLIHTTAVRDELAAFLGS